MSSSKSGRPNGAVPTATAQPPSVIPKTKLSKTERRELQEKQRAAKAASQPKEPTKKPDAAPIRPKAMPAPAPRAAVNNTSSAGPSAVLHTRGDNASIASNEQESRLRDLRIFSHFGFPSRGGTALSSSARAELHPAVIRLGLQFAGLQIVGANARCIATLTAFKTVIQDYVTPPQTTLSRHLMTHLSPQITHLVNARPMSTSMGNAIRYLKYEISILSIDLPEADAKQLLCEHLDHYIRDRIILADQIIQDLAIDKIHDDDVILVYARSSVVEKVLLKAQSMGKRFSVFVVDSGPLFEGKRMLTALTRADIKCTYCLLPAIGYVMPTISLVFLGAHALHANGALYSRAGTALVAMMAKGRNVPVLVCCETYKFSNGVPFDGFTKNELAPGTGGGHKSSLQSLSPLYDLTPADSISAVVTEVGLIPPSSVPTVLFRAGAHEQ